MHLSLSDLVACPSCGPEYGLILVPDRTVERRVREGVLGCAGCGRRYPIRSGVADLRVGAGSGETGRGAGAGESDATRLGGLLGLGEGAGAVLLVGGSVGSGAALSELLEGVEVIVAQDSEPGGLEAAAVPGLTVARVDEALPFRSGSLAAVGVLEGSSRWLAESSRVVRPGGRVLLEWSGTAGEVTRARAESSGLRVLATEPGALVAERAV